MKKQSRYPIRLPRAVKADAERGVVSNAVRQRAIEEAQKIVARYVPKDRDLVAELIAERREEGSRE